MGDLISRQAAISTIQKAYADTTGGNDKKAAWKNVGLTNALHIIQGLSSAEPEIIRCKDCKHWKHDHTCREHSLVSPMKANEFCSRGERKDNG